MTPTNCIKIHAYRFVYFVIASICFAGPDKVQLFKVQLMSQVCKMTPADATALEAQVGPGKDDPVAHYKLCEYYSRNQDYRKAAAHYRWLVEHHPASELLDQIPVTLFLMDDVPGGEGEQQLTKVWLDQIEKNPTNAQLFGNAASALELIDDERAIDFLEKASKLDPEKPDWPERLGRIYARRVRHGRMANESASARRSYESFEQALGLSDPSKRAYLLGDAAKAALLVGEYDKARRYANERLDRAIQSAADWNYGNAVHHGNLILGHIALHEGNVEQAEEYLVKAGKTPGSPQLNSFGPNMSLALELLKKGRKEKVIEYLELCKKFWKKAELDAWIDTAKTDGIPDFGANLDY